MNDLYEAISELLCAQTIEQKSARAKDVRSAFDAVKSLLDAAHNDISNGMSELQKMKARLEQAEKDAARWRDISYALNRGISGAGHGRRFKIVEICPMHGDEKEVNAIDVISAMQANKDK